jgi:AcrR family transcriptional regulator
MERDRRILEAAAEAFYEKGFHGVGVDELGRRAGLTGPALYRHFSGKDEILATLLNEALDELIAATMPVLDDPRSDLDRALRHHIDFAITHRHLVSVYQREERSLAGPWKKAFDRRRGEYFDGWEDLLARCFPDLGRARVAAAVQACLGMIFSVSYWPGRRVRGADIRAQLLQLLSHGIESINTVPTARE